MSEFVYEQDGKEYRVTRTQGKMRVMVLELGTGTTRDATFVEMARSYQMMASLYLRHLENCRAR